MPQPDRTVRLNTVVARTDLSRSTIYRKIAESAHSRLNSRSALTARAGGNPTSTAGLPIPSGGGRRKRSAMGDEGKRSGRERAANDNHDADSPDPEALRKVNDVALKLARIVERRMAREDFAARIAAANDNIPPSTRTPEGTDNE